MDSQRVLTSEGRRRFAALVQDCPELPARFRLAAASPYLRAQQTLEILLQHRPTEQQDAWQELLPDANPQHVIRRVSKQTGPLALVGHNPLMGDLLHRLTAHEAPEGFRPGTIASLDWDPGSAAARLRWIRSP